MQCGKFLLISTVDICQIVISSTKILPKNLIKQHPTPNTGTPDNSDEHFSHIVTLEHASVAELLPILRPLLPPNLKPRQGRIHQRKTRDSRQC